ncbi:DUF1768-domain-containing protein [Roridomyces roridus]|uniref:DUF1768-domain-containing protein n=1 Tax=Roridomyces roridus TaxID=1738132 RepID=A0AAD7BAW1_9AGAR|nr:DUF1768-domain-containing protein [Roridomyces roridus]
MERNFRVAHPQPALLVATQPRPRISFSGASNDTYYAFKNRAPYPVKYNGKIYPTSEHLFQAFKYMGHRTDLAERIRTVSTSSTTAFDLSMTLLEHQNPDWDILKIPKMEIVVCHKFSQHEKLKQLLLGTGDAELVNGSRDNFWGAGKTGTGRNEFGKLLERLRKTFREAK